MVAHDSFSVPADSMSPLDTVSRMDSSNDATPITRVRRSAASTSTNQVTHSNKKLRVEGGPNLYLHFSNGALTCEVPNGDDHNKVCIKMHKIRLPIASAGEMVVIEAQQENKYITGASSGTEATSGTVVIESGENVTLDRLTQNDKQLFHISRPTGNARKIKHCKTGLFLSASPSGISLVSLDDSTDFEMYNCNHS